MKKTVVFDFDGVIHSYTSGWQGVTEIPDPPVPGIKESIDDLRANYYEVIVVSTRTATPEGYAAVTKWLQDNQINVHSVRATKPPAFVYIDDRAICFDGDATTLLSKIENFKTWMQEPPTETVSVVRCKDCRNRQGECWCSKHSEIVSDDDFCSYGERRDSDG